MESNIEKLMQKRVIVTNWYPECPFEVGDILLLENGYYHNRLMLSEHEDVHAEYVEKATANFRPLHWSEFRELSELPEYIKYKDVIYHSGGWCRSYETQMPWIALDMIGRLFANNVTPATLEQYQQYITSRPKK